jgi:formylglycine-generating enzyme required for sulfatase activity
VSDQDKRPDKVNYDLTTPNVYGSGEQPRRPAAPEDRTTINNPARPTTEMPAYPASPNKYDLTSVNAGVPVPYDDDEAATPPPQTPQQQRPYAQPAQPSQQYAAQPRGKVPAWVWGGLGVSMLLLLACGGLLAYYFLSRPAAFTLRVLDAPGSKVYIDDVPSGVPQRDGSIIVQGLRAGEPRAVVVRQEGFAEWRTTVTGKDGEVLDLRASMTPVAAPKPSMPAEIDYVGRMVLVGAGEFVMGTDGSDQTEAPAHTVTLPDFYIDKYEVTNEQYDKFCKETGRPAPVNPDALPDYFQSNPKKPVMGVGYDDAVAYANWAGKRLPTEEEWEKAASWEPSAKRKRKWPWGDSEDKSRANVGTDGPVDVGQFAGGASAYGAQDMAGNVVEWVDSVFAAYPGSSYKDKDYGKSMRVYRGGSFFVSMNEARTTYRLARDSSYKTTEETKSKPSLVGFRCAVSADDPRVKSHLRASKTP